MPGHILPICLARRNANHGLCQHYLLRRFLERLFAEAPFEGDAWRSCVAAFLAVPGVPVLAQGGTTQAPAAFFYRLFQPKAGDPGLLVPEWTSLLQQLEALGDRRVTQLIITDDRSSWVLFLSEDFPEIVAFGGRPLPGPRYTLEDDDADLRSGKLVREVIHSASGLQLTKLSREKSGASVVLTDPSGATFTMVFERALRVRFPDPANCVVGRVIEVSGQTGRTWFVFQPIEPNGRRALSVQAASARFEGAQP